MASSSEGTARVCAAIVAVSAAEEGRALTLFAETGACASVVRLLGQPRALSLDGPAAALCAALARLATPVTADLLIDAGQARAVPCVVRVRYGCVSDRGAAGAGGWAAV